MDNSLVPIGTLLLFTDLEEGKDEPAYFSVGVIVGYADPEPYEYFSYIVHFADEQSFVYPSLHGIMEYLDEWNRFFKRKKRK